MSRADTFRSFEQTYGALDTLTEKEQKTRSLRHDQVSVLTALFQPRQLKEEAPSAQHLAELKRALRANGKLDPITVMKAGGTWWCIDGHHRLEAYQQAEGKRTTIPVHVFTGTLADALRVSIAANAPDKLNLTQEDKLEAAWVMAVLGLYSVAEISTTTTVGERTVQRMRRAMEQLRKLHPKLDCGVLKWWQVKMRLRGEDHAEQDGWEEAQVIAWAKKLVKTFGSEIAKHPERFYKAVRRYNALAAKKVSECGVRVEHIESGETDF